MLCSRYCTRVVSNATSVTRVFVQSLSYILFETVISLLYVPAQYCTGWAESKRFAAVATPLCLPPPLPTGVPAGKNYSAVTLQFVLNVRGPNLGAFVFVLTINDVGLK